MFIKLGWCSMLRVLVSWLSGRPTRFFLAAGHPFVFYCKGACAEDDLIYKISWVYHSHQFSNFLINSLYFIYSFSVFHHQRQLTVLYWSFSDSKILKSPGLFSVFWPSSIMLSFGWSPLVRQFTIYYYYYHYYYYYY